MHGAKVVIISETPKKKEDFLILCFMAVVNIFGLIIIKDLCNFCILN